MDELIFQPALELMLGSPGAAPLARLLAVAATIADAPSVALISREHGISRCIISHNVPHMQFGATWAVQPNTDFLIDSGNSAVERMELVAKVKRPKGLPPWRWVFAVRIPLPGLSFPVSLVCADTSSRQRAADINDRLRTLAQIIGDEMSLIGHLSQMADIVKRTSDADSQVELSSMVRESQLPFDFAPKPPPSAGVPASAPVHQAEGDVVSQFLIATLIRHVRLIQRDGIGYHAIHRWRSPIKDWQIMALRMLKAQRDAALIAHIAADIVNSLDNLGARSMFGAVAAVPCGSSGPGCLAHQVGEAVAARLSLPFVAAIHPLPANGSSHPRRNASRRAMQIRQAVDVPTLLVDDVATSGAHIIEATRLLRSVAPMVAPIVWLAP